MNPGRPQSDRPSITPQMKVDELLSSYPELEAVLYSLSPTFQALKNPILRRTVAKVATLQQVATVGNLSVGTLIERLREAAGVSDHAPMASCPDSPIGKPESSTSPDWADPTKVVRSFDARPTLEAGAHPMERVMRDLSELKPGEVYELLTPFFPEPLRDLAVKKGYESFSRRDESEPGGEPGPVRTYFRRGA